MCREWAHDWQEATVEEVTKYTLFYEVYTK